MEDGLRLRGVFEVLVRDSEGVVKDKRVVPNIITTAGLTSVSALMTYDVGDTGFDYLAIGTGTAAAAVTQTTLVGEAYRIGGANVTGTQVTTTKPNDTMQLVGTLTSTATHAIVECGVFNAAAAGTLLARQVFSAINVVSADSIQVTYKVSVA